MGLVYWPTLIPSKSIGKYTVRPMDPSFRVWWGDLQGNSFCFTVVCSVSCLKKQQLRHLTIGCGEQNLMILWYNMTWYDMIISMFPSTHKHFFHHVPSMSISTGPAVLSTAWMSKFLALHWFTLGRDLESCFFRRFVHLKATAIMEKVSLPTTIGALFCWYPCVNYWLNP